MKLLLKCTSPESATHRHSLQANTYRSCKIRKKHMLYVLVSVLCSSCGGSGAPTESDQDAALSANEGPITAGEAMVIDPEQSVSLVESQATDQSPIVNVPDQIPAIGAAIGESEVESETAYEVSAIDEIDTNLEINAVDEVNTALENNELAEINTNPEVNAVDEINTAPEVNAVAEVNAVDEISTAPEVDAVAEVNAVDEVNTASEVDTVAEVNIAPEVNALVAPIIEPEAEIEFSALQAELIDIKNTCPTCKALRLSWPDNPSAEEVDGYRVLFVPESSPLAYSIVSDVPVAGLDENCPKAVFDLAEDLNLPDSEGGCFMIKAYRGSEESEASEAVCFSRG